MRSALVWLGCTVAWAAALPPAGHEQGRDTIVEKDIEGHLAAIATAPLEGRDSPSAGLSKAGDYIIERLKAAGFEGAGKEKSFRLPFARSLPAPRAEGCALLVTPEGGETTRFELGVDFVPLPMCTGKGEGPPVFAGFGIRTKKAGFDELKRADLKGAVAVILEGEPRHKTKFEGPVVTPDADVHVKIKNLVDEGVEAVLVVRRAPEEGDAVEYGDGGGDRGKEKTPPSSPPGISFRHTWASWNPSAGHRDQQVPRTYDVQVLEITAEAASRILGTDVEAVARELDRTAKPATSFAASATVRVESAIETRSVSIDNVAAILRGSDPKLAEEFVVVGAHYDHVGVDMRGQVGYGADDNGSGTVALLEIAEALGQARPKRSVLACAFAAEEDGLLGSADFVSRPPVPIERMVAMLNLDMIGRGDEGAVVVLGTDQNPDLEDALERARRLEKPPIKVVTGKAEHLWQRSDHFSFHSAGVPVLFFFEAVSELDNEDYHTWRDTIDKLNLEKITRTARLVYSTAWVLAEDDRRPSPPR